MNNIKNKNGITLIALVITIIVMLILVAVTIRVAQDGNLFKHAANATSKTKIAAEGENELSSGNIGGKSIEQIVAEQTGETVAIDWEEVLANATKHPDQHNSEDIGIGTDGKPVNLDLWNYTDDEKGTNGWQLYDSDNRRTGYENANIVNGRIQGTVPQYIKTGTEEFLPVTRMNRTFEDCTSLIVAPSIPTTVYDMGYCFHGCTSLTTAPAIPDSVEFMDRTFWGCSSLLAISNIPRKVSNLGDTFRGCSSLTAISDIPSTVEGLTRTFMGCTGITTAPNIPTSVMYLTQAFSGCTGLTEVPRIWERVTSDTTTYQGQPYGEGCFEGCTNASNYADIPNYWKTYTDTGR